MGKKIQAIIFTSTPALVILLLAAILFRPFFLTGQVPIPGDILIGHYHPWADEIWEERVAGYPIKNFSLFDGVRQTLPWRLLAIEQMKLGKPPLWNPYIFSGMPLLGNLQVAAFYPLNMLFFIFSGLNAWTIYIFCQPVLAAFFTYFFLRTIGRSREASLFAGITYGFSLIMMNHLEFGIDGHTALWLPLGLGAINKIQNQGQWRWAVIFTISVGMSLLGGYPPPLIYNLIILCAYALFRIRPLISSKILIVILGISLAFLLTASQILPAFDLAQRVTREETQFGVLSKEPYFFPWENLIMILAPDFFGHPATGNFSSRIFFPDNPSIGIIGFLFVAYSFLRIFRKKEIAFWAFFVIYPTLLMLGTPLGQALRLLPIPALSLVTPIKMIWVVAFSLSVLAGIGMDVVSELIRKDWSWRFFSPMVIVWEIIFLVWIAGFLIPAGEQIRVAQRNLFLPTLFLATGSGFIAISLFLPKFWPFIASLIIGLSGTELVHQGIKYNPFINKGLVFPQTEIFKRICEKGDTWRAMIVHPELLPVNSNIPYRISMIDGYASMYDGRYGRLVRLANATLPIREIGGYPRIVFQTEYNSPIIDLLNVRWVLSLSELKNPKLKLVAREGQTALYENINAGPKVFLARQFYVEKNDLTIAQKMLEIDLSKEVVLEEHPNLMAIAEDKSLSEGKAEIIAYQPGKVIVKTQTSTAGILVLTDTYDSGWKAFVGRKATKVFRADYDLRAVEVPAGEHEVEFVYDPLSFKIGLGISLLTVSSLLIGAFLFRIKNLNLVGGLRQREH